MDHGPEGVDITVVAPQQLFGGGDPINIHGGFILSGEVCFLGFPFGHGSEVGAVNSDFPVPWVKRDIVSAFSGDSSIVYIDGHNKPGFSGGPAVQERGSEVGILAVISDYKHHRRKEHDNAGRVRPICYDLNTGIVVSYNASRITQIVSDNPVGCPIRPR